MKRKLFIGLKIEGVDHLAIEGGEAADDFHVTLLYGSFDQIDDEEHITASIQSAIAKIKQHIPDKLSFDSMGRFEASESSDGKDVIYASVEMGQLEKARNILIKELKKDRIKITDTFPVYHPHMTLAYINPEEDYPLDLIEEEGNVTKVLYSINTEEEHGRTFEITKADEDKRLVFGWANIATRANGEVIQDWQDDIVDPEDLEEAVYEYVLNFRDSGEQHNPDLRKKGRMVESVVFTDEKLEAMGIPKGTVPLGWWIGFYVDDDTAWEKIKNGTYKMFSVEGQGKRVPVDDLETRMRKSIEDDVLKSIEDHNMQKSIEENLLKSIEAQNTHVAKTFSDIIKFNPYHDRLGRFTGPGGYASFSANPDTKAGKLAIKRAQKNNPLIGAAYGTLKTEGQKQQEKRDKQSVVIGNRIMQEYGITGAAGKQTTAEIEELYRDIDRNGGLKLNEDGRPSIKRATYEKVVDLSKRAAERASYTDESTKADYDEIRRYVKNNPVKISEQDKSNIADFESYKRSNFGNMTVSNKGVSMDSFYQSLAEQYPHYFDVGKYTNPGDQMAHVNTVLSSLKPKVVQLSPTEKQTMATEMTKHIITGYFVKDDYKMAKSYFDIEKFNPYHDQLGRFTTPGGATSFTYSPGKSKAHDAAIAREKERQKAEQEKATPKHVSAATGKTYAMPKLETEEAERDRAKALEDLELHFSWYPNRNKKLIDEKMPAYLEETDPKEWNKRAKATPVGAVHYLTSAKTKAQKEQEAIERKDRASWKAAKERSASKRTQAHERYKEYEASLKAKYPAKDMFDRRSWYSRATAAERQKLEELDDARVFRNKRGQWQVAKNFLSLLRR